MRRDRRHRPPRQPPRALGGRAAGEPVQHRPRAHGAHHPRAHDAAGQRAGHAVRPDQLAHHLGGDPVVLRLEPALAVHGPDQPAGRADAQAPPVGARTRRPDARPRRLRGARRALHALRPHVPDRDAGRPEHRPDLVARDLRARQRVRLPRDAVPEGEERRRGPKKVEFLSADIEDRFTHRARRTRRSTRRPASSSTTRCTVRAPRRVPDRRRRRASTTWTSRRSSWCRRPPR